MQECPDDHRYVEYEMERIDIPGYVKIMHRFRCIYCGVKATVSESVPSR